MRPNLKFVIIMVAGLVAGVSVSAEAVLQSTRPTAKLGSVMVSGSSSTESPAVSTATASGPAAAVTPIPTPQASLNPKEPPYSAYLSLQKKTGVRIPDGIRRRAQGTADR
ncbi:MAG: hypothetical protein WCG06_00760 [Candidatus Omnitrophota bacterium]